MSTIHVSMTLSFKGSFPHTQKFIAQTTYHFSRALSFKGSFPDTYFRNSLQKSCWTFEFCCFFYLFLLIACSLFCGFQVQEAGEAKVIKCFTEYGLYVSHITTTPIMYYHTKYKMLLMCLHVSHMYMTHVYHVWHQANVVDAWWFWIRLLFMPESARSECC